MACGDDAEIAEKRLKIEGDDLDPRQTQRACGLAHRDGQGARWQGATGQGGDGSGKGGALGERFLQPLSRWREGARGGIEGVVIDAR